MVSGIYNTFLHHIDMSSKRKDPSAENYKNPKKPKLLIVLHYKAEMIKGIISRVIDNEVMVPKFYAKLPHPTNVKTLVIGWK